MKLEAMGTPLLSLAFLVGELVCLGDAVVEAGDALNRLILDTTLSVDELALVGAVVEEAEERGAFEAFKHEACIGLSRSSNAIKASVVHCLSNCFVFNYN